MKNKISILLIVFISSFYSCENSFSTIKEIDLPEHTEKLSVFTSLKNNSATVFISHSKSMDDNSAYLSFKADVSILENNKEIIQFEYDTKDNSEITYALSDSIKEGAEYKIIVNSDKFGTAEATQIAPNKANIKSIEIKKDAIIDKYDNGYNNILKINLNDEKGIDNFYFIKLLGLDSIRDNQEPKYNRIYFHPNENTTATNVYFNGYEGVIFSDKNYDGRTRSMEFVVQKSNYSYPPSDITKYKLRIYSITKDLYNYLISRYYNDDAEYNPFAEPVIIHSNIENGYGLFSAEMKREWIIDVE